MKPNPQAPSDIILYQTDDGSTRLEVQLQDETVWLSQAQMAELFQTSVPNVSMHIRNVFSEGEVQAASVVKESLTTAADGKDYLTKYYNLDVIISVGYRVKSNRGTQFRIWATQRLREYLIKGFTMDDERLKELGGGKYFDELLARIRDNSQPAILRESTMQIAYFTLCVCGMIVWRKWPILLTPSDSARACNVQGHDAVAPARA